MEATERDTDDIGSAGGRPGRPTWTVLAALASVGAVVGAVVAATWSTTRVGDTVLATLVAIAGTVLAVLVVAAIGRRTRQARGLRTAVVVSTLVLGLVVAALSWNGTLVTSKAARSVPSWQAAADRILDEGAERGAATGPDTAAPCVFGPQIEPDLRELDGFGRVDQICSSSAPGFRFVSFSQTDGESWSGRWTGLVYSPDADDPMVMSTCVAHLDGPWWQTAGANPNCPPGHVFVGGG